MKDESCPHYEVCTEMYGDEECAGWMECTEPYNSFWEGVEANEKAEIYDEETDE